MGIWIIGERRAVGVPCEGVIVMCVCVYVCMYVAAMEKKEGEGREKGRKEGSQEGREQKERSLGRPPGAHHCGRAGSVLCCGLCVCHCGGACAVT